MQSLKVVNSEIESTPSPLHQNPPSSAKEVYGDICDEEVEYSV